MKHWKGKKHGLVLIATEPSPKDDPDYVSPEEIDDYIRKAYKPERIAALSEAELLEVKESLSINLRGWRDLNAKRGIS